MPLSVSSQAKICLVLYLQMPGLDSLDLRISLIKKIGGIHIRKILKSSKSGFRFT